MLRIISTDPEHTAEHLALWSVRRFAGRASSETRRMQLANPNTSPDQLQPLVVERQTRVAMTEGAFVGGPFIALMPVAFCAALLAQAQMVMELAALAGYAPDDEMRAVDLLVLQGAYPSESAAQHSLRRLQPSLGGASRARSTRRSRWSAVKRLALLLGVLDSGKERPSLVHTVVQWTLLGLLFLIGLVLPFVWMPYMAVAMRRSALDIGERGMRFYAQRRSADAGVAVRTARAIRVPLTGTLVRTLILVVLPVAIALIALATGADFGTGKLLTAGLVMVAASALLVIGWFCYRWWRQRRRRASVAPGGMATAGGRGR